MSISCSTDSLIRINSASYGHDIFDFGDEWYFYHLYEYDECHYAVDITGDCNGKMKCEIAVSTNRFGDTCNIRSTVAKYNYLKVDYDCLCKYSYAKKI